MLAGVLVTKLMHLKVSWYLFPIKSRFGKDSITQPAPAEAYPAHAQLASSDANLNLHPNFDAREQMYHDREK